jgi:cellobiose phosphorylase
MSARTYPLSQSKHGYFSPDATEYVITEPDLMRPWLNFLANGKYQIWLSQTLGGMSLFNQDLRINNYYGKFDVPGKYVFVRDDDSGKYWSANWAPFFRPLQHFRCIHGMNYSTLETQTDGIRTTIRVLLPPGEACEVWTVTVENRTNRTRTLSLYPYVQWRLACFIRADNEHEWFSETDFHRGENCVVAKYRDPHHLENDYEGFIGSSLPIQGYDCSDRAFFGTFYNRYRKSEALEKGRCANSRGWSEQTIGALQHRVELAPSELKTFQVIMGYSSKPAERKRLIAKYSDPSNVRAAAEENRKHWQRLIEQITVKTPDPIFDRTVNVRLKYQTWMCILWCRSGSLRFGYRDILQDSRGVVAADCNYTKERFLEPLRYQFKDGHAVRQWSRSSNNHDARPYMDSHLWIVHTLTAYIKETGDASILKIRAPYFDGGSDTVLGHAVRGLDYSWKMRGKHGLQLIMGGDVNDAFDRVGDKGRGESVWLSEFYYYVLTEMEKLATFVGDKRLAATCAKRAAAVRKAVNTAGWDGAWYRRCFDDEGGLVGSKSNRDARIHLMSQVWAALSGIGTRGHDATAMDSVERLLKNDLGYEIFTPAYRKKDPNIGQFSALTGFMNNNNYVHHNAMKMGADIRLGRGDLAYETFRKMEPSNPKNNPKGPRVEPYAYANCIVSSRHERPGESEIGWVTGSTSWWFTMTTEWMMGAIPDYEGLRIDPCLPKKWKKVELTRPFRGATYHVTVLNPDGVNKGVKSVAVDGKMLRGNLIRPHGDGMTHEVVVTLG